MHNTPPQLCPFQALPTSTIFKEPLFIELGLQTGLDPSKSVPTTPVIEAVLRRAGYVLEALPAGWTRWDSRTGIYKRVIWTATHAFRRGLLAPFKNRGNWSLTPKGVERARPLIEALAPPPPQQNLTAQWFQEHLTPKRGQERSPLMSQMEAALRRHLPLSYHMDQIGDHINTYIMRAIRRDALAKHLQAGELPYGKVVSYCVNSGRTDARNMGTEPVCREMFGARTEQERRKGVPTVTPEEIALDMNGDPILSLGTPPEMSFENVWRRIEVAVHSRKPKAGDRYAHILALRAQGYSLDEIAQFEGVSRNRAAAMLADVRRCLRSGSVEKELGW